MDRPRGDTRLRLVVPGGDGVYSNRRDQDGRTPHIHEWVLISHMDGPITRIRFCTGCFEFDWDELAEQARQFAVDQMLAAIAGEPPLPAKDIQRRGLIARLRRAA